MEYFHHNSNSYDRKLCMMAGSSWRKLKGAEHLSEVISGVQFKDGMREDIEKIAA